MNRQELKKWSKEKIKGKRWTILPAIIVTSILCNLGFSYDYSIRGYKTSINFSYGNILFYFVQIGFTALMIKFITDQEFKTGDIFSTSKDFVKYLVFGLIKNIFIFLWALLFIIPGIIKSIAYSMTDLLLLDDKYKNFSDTDILKKSEEIMNGHKTDYFVLELSFIGWHILSVFTLFILEFWVIPYQKTTTIKFLYDVKNKYEQENDTSVSDVVNTLNNNEEKKK